MSKPKIIAFYLPQYHPIPENDEWWGKGFTEWTNVGKARPLFKGHDQPKVPADLGYYDLRVPEVREQQAELAKEAGICGFCYWHYWFGNGKRLLERPFKEVLDSGKPDFPFCLAWANESWKGFYHGLKNRNILIEQQYGGIEDYKNHFYEVLPAFRDPRYIQIEGKPLFMIYRPFESPEIPVFIKVWQELAKKEGLKGIFFVGHNNAFRDNEEIFATGVDAVNTLRLQTYANKRKPFYKRVINKIRKLRKEPLRYSFPEASKYFLIKDIDSQENIFPTIISGWDHTPRTGNEGFLYNQFNPDVFKKHAEEVLKLVTHKTDPNKIIFLKSWNEWAEGNYMEPDLKYGKGYIEALAEALKEFEKD